MTSASAVVTATVRGLEKRAGTSVLTRTTPESELFRQATAEGHPAIRLDAGRPVKQGNRLYTNSSW